MAKPYLAVRPHYDYFITTSYLKPGGKGRAINQTWGPYRTLASAKNAHKRHLKTMYWWLLDDNSEVPGLTVTYSKFRGLL